MNRFITVTEMYGNYTFDINVDHIVKVVPNAQSAYIYTFRDTVAVKESREEVHQKILATFTEYKVEGSVTGRSTHTTADFESVDKFNNVKNFQGFARNEPDTKPNLPFTNDSREEEDRKAVENLYIMLAEDQKETGNCWCLYGVHLLPIIRGYLDKVPDPSISLEKILDGFDDRKRELDQIYELKDEEQSELKEFGYKHRAHGATHTVTDFGNIRRYFEREISKLRIYDMMRIKWLENKMRIAARALLDSADTDP